ncbi:MAG: protease pro-enzyme activation domain-containing protein [Acidimicrobiales bacterium]
MAGRTRLACGAAVLAVCSTLGVGMELSTPAGAATSEVIGTPAAVPAVAHALGQVSASTPVHVSVVLRSQDPSGLEDLATAVSTPGSASFRHGRRRDRRTRRPAWAGAGTAAGSRWPTSVRRTGCPTACPPSTPLMPLAATSG